MGEAGSDQRTKKASSLFVVVGEWTVCVLLLAGGRCRCSGRFGFLVGAPSLVLWFLRGASEVEG